MVLHKHGEKLYSGLIATLKEHLKGVASKIEATQGVPFLKELKRRWDDHNKSTQMIRDILMVRARLRGVHSPTMRCSRVLCLHPPPLDAHATLTHMCTVLRHSRCPAYCCSPCTPCTLAHPCMPPPNSRPHFLVFMIYSVGQHVGETNVQGSG